MSAAPAAPRQIRRSPARCAVEGCKGDEYLDGLCKLHADARWYCEHVLQLEDYDLTHFARFVA